MAGRKSIPPPLAGPKCPSCERQAAELARLLRQQRQQASEIRKLNALLREQSAVLQQERQKTHALETALTWLRTQQPFLVYAFAKRLPKQGKRALSEGLFHLN